MSVVTNLSPILFLTLHHVYDISYSLLGLLVLVNFVTQLAIDLVFSFFSHRFNIARAVVLTPVLTALGLIIYALCPLLFPGRAYLGFVIGTFFFSVSGGLSEVLISPVIAAIPSKDPDREMSKLHSVYAWGVVFVVIFSTIFLRVFGTNSWYMLTLVLTVIPLAAFCLYLGTDIPKMQTPDRVLGVLEFMKNKNLWICFFVIFLGGASEATMTQWSSSFLEQGLGIPKVWGDILGVALFFVMLGTGRTLYAKFGKNITQVLLLGTIGAAICYGMVALCPVAGIGLIFCVLTGFCVSMLWPGSILVASERFPTGGVFIYAMMAAGGDLGASIAPQLVGIVTDAAISNPAALELAQALHLAPEQLGLKLGMLVGALFPLAAIPLYAYIHKARKKS
nr:MFS transporter [bacterium]